MVTRSLGLAAAAVVIGSVFSSAVSAEAPASAGSAPVTVVNTPLPVTVTAPLPVTDVSDRTPFQALLCTPGCQGGGTSDQTTKIHVPAGSRLVIEYVSLYCGTLVDYVQIHTIVNGKLESHFPGVPVQSRSGGPFISAQSVRIYADPDTNVTAGQGVPGAFAACDMHLSGYTTTP
jgi:hypothetical protein